MVRVETGMACTSELVFWAMERISNDEMSDGLLELASLQKPSVYEALKLAHQSANELSIVLPNESQLKLLLAKNIAENIISGKIDPNIGCSKIGELNRELDWPKELSGFGLLSHEQTGHEHIGITRANIVPEILKEAKALLKT